MKGIPNIPFNLALITTEPVARTTTMNVPIISAKNILWLGVNLFVIFVSVFCSNLRDAKSINQSIRSKLWINKDVISISQHP